MKTFKEWISALTTNSKYGSEKDAKKRLEWCWRDYLEETFESAVPPVHLGDDNYESKMKSAVEKAAGDNDKDKVKNAVATLSAFSQTLIEKYRFDNVPTQDDGTLCMYHAFSHLPAVPDEERGALRLCAAWKTKRFVPGFTYDDDLCARMMALEYGLRTWSPVKGRDIKELYTTPGTRLIVTVIRTLHKIPITYWTDRTWYQKTHQIEGNMALQTVLTDEGSAAHCIYAEVDAGGKIQFFDNENEQGRATDQIVVTAIGLPLRCL